jgi:hypothetical protein
MTATIRARAERVADAQRALRETIDCWLATASGGIPHLVPLSMAWDDATDEIVLCTDPASVTVRNVEAGGRQVRLGVGPTDDVVMLVGDVRVTSTVADDDATAELFATRTGWDPRPVDGHYVLLRFRPDRAQAWRHAGELRGRTVMRDGKWLS